MLKSISFKKLAVLSAGIAIVLSSCGLQNEASESSGAGKTKNFALLGDGTFCYDSTEEQQTAVQVQNDAHRQWHMNPTTIEDHQAIFDKLTLIFNAQIGGCPAPAPEAAPAVEAAIYSCVKPEKKQEMIDGYKEQIAKTDYPADWSASVIADYKAQMQRGLEIAEVICTN
jgi:hypothetical protein